MTTMSMAEAGTVIDARDHDRAPATASSSTSWHSQLSTLHDINLFVHPVDLESAPSGSRESTYGKRTGDNYTTFTYFVSVGKAFTRDTHPDTVLNSIVRQVDLSTNSEEKMLLRPGRDFNFINTPYDGGRNRGYCFINFSCGEV